VLFTADAAAGIADGTITVTYRRWKRPQAVVGGRYRTVGGFIVVDAVEVVDAAEVPAGVTVRGDPSLSITRVRFHRDDDHDPRAELAADTDVDVEALSARLDRMDARAPDGAWTRQALEIIERRPGRRAGDLAAELGRRREEWKRDVRKLKELGLTLSLPVGYRLSPRGEAYLEAVRRGSRPGGGSGTIGGCVRPPMGGG
jgi:hypothetical protein